MSLPSRLKALAKRVAALEIDVEQGRAVSPYTIAALMQLEAALDELDKTLLPTRRGRPKKHDAGLQQLAGLVAVLKAWQWEGVKTNKQALQRIFRGRKVNLHTWENKLAQARKARR